MTEDQTDLELFAETVPDEEEDSLARSVTHVLASNWSIGPLLSRGCLAPPAFGNETGLAFFDETWRHGLPAVVGPIPAEWSEHVRGGRRNAFPIAVRLKSECEYDCVVLSLDEVEALIFDTEDELSIMLTSPFSDYDLAALGLVMETDSSVFGGTGTGPMPSSERRHPSADDLRRADSLGAVRAILPRVASPTDDWVATLQAVWRWPYRAPVEGFAVADSCIVSVSDEEWATAMEERGLEERLLGVTAGQLCHRFDLSVGWPASEVLDSVTAELFRHTLDASERTHLEGWAELARDAIRGHGEVPPLSDEKGTGFRAVTYLLLRGGDPASVVGSDRDGTVKVGHRVRALAAILASIRFGLRALPVELKTPGDADLSRIWLGALGRSVLADLGMGGPADHVQVEERSDGALDGWRLVVGGTEVFESSDGSKSPLAAVVEICEGLGFSVAEVGDRRIDLIESGNEGSGRQVRIVARAPDSESGTVLSLVTPIVDLASRSQSAPWPTLQARELTKSQLFVLLESNADPSLPGSISLSEFDRAVVLTNRILLPDGSSPEAVASEVRDLMANGATAAERLRVLLESS